MAGTLIHRWASRSRDGICTGVLPPVFFQRTGREKVTTDLKGLADSELARANLAPLDIDMLVTMSLSSRGCGFSGLDQHTLPHRESVDYGTRENSPRAIFLRNYVAQSLRREPPEIEQCAETDALCTTITKLEAGNRQLTTAIRMYLADGDAVAVHTLACVTREICEKYCANLERDGQFEYIESANPKRGAAALWNVSNGARNFFKHASESLDEAI